MNYQWKKLLQRAYEYKLLKPYRPTLTHNMLSCIWLCKLIYPGQVIQIAY